VRFVKESGARVVAYHNFQFGPYTAPPTPEVSVDDLAEHHIHAHGEPEPDEPPVSESVAAAVAEAHEILRRAQAAGRTPWGGKRPMPPFLLRMRWRARPDDFRLPSRETLPVIRLVSAVITKLEERAPAEGDLHAALVDRAGRWIAPGVVAGFADRLDALAATISTDFNILVLGRSRDAMARAVNRLLAVHGGVVLVDGNRVTWELALPLGGIMTGLELPEAARRQDELHARLRAHGYAFHDPFFTLLFLAADFLPAVRLTPRGVWDVRGRRLLLPRRRRV